MPDLCRNRNQMALFLLSAMAGMFLLSGCEEEQSATPPDVSASIGLASLQASQVMLDAGDSTIVSVRVVSGGETAEPLSGATVRFGEVGIPFGEESEWASGQFDPLVAVSDSLGWVQTTYQSYATSSGQVDLKASSDGVIEYLSIYLGGGQPGEGDASLSVASAETTIPADGVSTLELTVTLTRDGAGVPGATVYLTAGELFEDVDGDGAWSEGDRVLIDADGDSTWDAIGSVTSPQTTNSSGIATAVYTAGYAEGDVFIKVTADSLATDFGIVLHCEQSTISVAALPLEVWADGFSTVLVTAEVRDADSAPLAGKMVRFTVGEPFEDMDGDGYYTPEIDSFSDLNENGAWDVMGTIASAATTGLDGTVTAAFQAGRVPGVATLHASTREISTRLNLQLLELPRVSSASWSWAPAFLYANGLSEATLSAQVFDINGMPIPGKEIELSATAGSIASSAITDLDGLFTVSYQAPESAGTIMVTLSAGSWSLDVPLEIMALPDLLTIEFSTEREEIHLLGSGGEDRTTLMAVCVTLDGSAAPPGLPVLFEITAGPDGGELFESSVMPSATVVTDAEGIASAVLRAGSLPGPVHVSVSYGALERALALSIAVGPPAVIAAYPERAELTSWEQTTIHMTVKDAYNLPVKDGTLLHLEVDEGLVLGDEGQSTSRTVAGQATALFYSLSPEPGGDGQAEILIRAEPGGIEGHTSISIPVAEETISLMTLEADPAELTVLGQVSGDYAVIRAACLLRADVPAPAGIPVVFSIVSGPGGGEQIGESPDSVTVETNAAGVAQVALHSGTCSGPLHIQAASGNVTKHLYLGISAGPPVGVHCWPQFATLDPGDTTEVYVVIDDEYNNPVVDGTVAHLTVDHGFVFTENGSGTAPTVRGMLTAFYIALVEDTTIAFATITCATDGDVVGETTVALTAPTPPAEPGPIARVTLIPTSTEIGVRETGATEQCFVYAYCYDDHNQAVGREREVTFEIVAGPNGGEAIDDQGWGPVTVYTDDTSRAHVVLSSGTISGTVRIQASAGELASQAAQVSIAAGPPAYISVGADPRNICGWDVVGQMSGITAIASDIYNNPVSDGTTIYLTCDEGIIRGWDGNLGSATTVGGVALGTYLSGLPRQDGIVIITASTSGGTVLGWGGLIVSGRAVSVEYISPTPPASIWADGDSELRMTVEVLDINGNYVLDGTGVEFYTSLGTVDEMATTSDGVYGSLARSILRSETLGRDYSWTVPDDGIGGTTVVVASVGLAGSHSDGLEVDFLTGNAFRGNSRINLEESVEPSTSIFFDVEIKDRYGNPLGGHALELSATGGGTVSPSGTTDPWGIATLIFTAPAADTTCTVSVYDADPGYGGITLSETVFVQ